MAGALSRRDFVKAAVATAAGAALGVGTFSAFVPALSGGPAARMPGPILLGNGGSATQVPLTLRDLDGPGVVVAPGTWMFQPAVVFKVPKAALSAAADVRGYNTGQHALQHPTEAGNVVLAYDAKCTHLGCTVAFNTTLGASRDVADYDGDGTVEGRMICPCHQSQFDVFDLGHNLPAMPAQRPLDVITLRWGAERDGSPTLEGVERIRQQSYRDADRQASDAFRLAG